MRRSAIIAATFATLAAAAHAAGKEQVYYTITLQEARLATAGPAQAYVGRNDGRVQQLQVVSFDWGGAAARVNKVDSFTVKQKVKPAGTSDLTLKRGTSAGAAGGLGKDLQAQDRMGNAPSSTGIGAGIGGWANDGDEAAPPPSGTLRVKVRFPWLACEEGKFYPQLVMGSPVKTTYILSDATVTGCSNEAVTFSYSKVEFDRVKPH